MRKIVVTRAAVTAAILVAAACRSMGSNSSTPGTDGALSSTAAVQQFLAAARGGDVRAMSALFGTSDGSITRRDSPNDVEKRMRSLQCYLTHDSARVLEDGPGLAAERRVSVELRQKSLVRRTMFTSVAGPQHRWYVETFDIEAVRDLCHP